MLLSKEKIIIAYYYIALIAFAVSACAVMFDQESYRDTIKDYLIVKCLHAMGASSNNH